MIVMFAKNFPVIPKNVSDKIYRNTHLLTIPPSYMGIT